jgi:hypothetical protein
MTDEGKSPSANQPSSQFESLVFTLRPKTGEILKIEGVDAARNRRELSKTEIAELAKQTAGPSVEALVERAFEAGIACLLDGENGKDDEAETEDEAGVRQILLKSLIEGSAAARTIGQDARREAIIRTLIHDIADTSSSSPR